MPAEEFNALVGKVSAEIADRPLDDGLAAHLNATFPKDGPDFERLAALCAEGDAEGWLMAREAGGIKFGRAVKPGTDAGRFSVDVVRMKDVRGPHHVHTQGEIGAVLPIAGAPKFDDFDAGWYVYAPGTDHHPTVSGGDAYVVYWLPDGAIEFTGKP
ncbi:MAG: DUF4863 family protein [Roseitalea sp.]|uniref:4-hydroxylaminobenzoate lyase n=1 Tax=Oceaniradius stylonematis TaxID=2184161 RepID=UPI001B01D776|nr:DUF4863 family protein [Oceaniradius stylonematis]MBO6552723.1 DUF4863 family protein [Roseitalea sp.]MBO6950356.1 DUF4863 family protein [Rhizobiaceae bacterium]MBO6591655.1 DUF4863 family protein [Roseitalea sp.]MBO6599510.1 DUF4863 family protein [Roseitalea sp.]MBO6612002.1 DUF4863 family protein [Roseitalea sp.]